LADPSEVLLKVVNGKIKMVRIWLRVPRITVGTRIEASENALATTEVVPARRDSSARVVEHGGIIGGGLINVGNRHNNAKESS
jgi:hypothetical protein